MLQTLWLLRLRLLVVVLRQLMLLLAHGLLLAVDTNTPSQRLGHVHSLKSCGIRLAVYAIPHGTLHRVRELPLHRSLVLLQLWLLLVSQLLLLLLRLLLGLLLYRLHMMLVVLLMRLLRLLLLLLLLLLRLLRESLLPRVCGAGLTVGREAHAGMSRMLLKLLCHLLRLLLPHVLYLLHGTQLRPS